MVTFMSRFKVPRFDHIQNGRKNLGPLREPPPSSNFPHLRCPPLFIPLRVRPSQKGLPRPHFRLLASGRFPSPLVKMAARLLRLNFALAEVDRLRRQGLMLGFEDG